MKLLPPAAILARLEHSLGLLVGGRRDVPDRQRTLRATIAWSHDLLSEAAQAAAGGVLGLPGRYRPGRPRGRLRRGARSAAYRCWTRCRSWSTTACCGGRSASASAAAVRDAGDRPRVRGRAAARAAGAGAGSARPMPRCSGRWPRTSPVRRRCPDRAGLDLLELEHDNFRAALDWYAETDPAAALRLANRLTAFWSVRGHFSEGRRRLGELLELVPDDDPERVDALNGAAWLATDQGDRASAMRTARGEHRPRPRRTMTLSGEATGLFYRGRAKLIIGDPAGGRADIERALELADRGRRRRRPRGGPVVARGGGASSRTSSGLPANGSNAARSCPRRSACPPSSPCPAADRRVPPRAR